MYNSAIMPQCKHWIHEVTCSNVNQVRYKVAIYSTDSRSGQACVVPSGMSILARDPLGLSIVGGLFIAQLRGYNFRGPRPVGMRPSIMCFIEQGPRPVGMRLSIMCFIELNLILTSCSHEL